MTHEDKNAPPPGETRPAAPSGETKGAAEWIAIGEGAAGLAMQALQTFGPSSSGQAPPETPPPETPTVILPPGVDPD